ncbi:MAG: AlpA family phage regulatory protein [Burkholderiales bacterium]|nr:AlpA family phage regulatory protein [Burkholderiales bacterium]
MTKPAFFRLSQIVSTGKQGAVNNPIIPVSRSTWWQWVKDGKAPQPVKLSKRTTAWRAADITALIETLNANEGAMK